MTRVIGLILAAGSGNRVGQPKAEIVIGGERLLERAARVMEPCAELLAVVRAGTRLDGVRTVVNPTPERGMRSSLELAVETAGRWAPVADAFAVTLVDVPGITAEGVATVLDAWQANRIAVATYGRTRGHPIVMAPGDWRQAIAMAGPDEGARRFLAANADLVDEVAAPGDPSDLDDPSDLARWRRLLG